LAAVGIGTYLILKNQLKEMHEGGGQTDKIIAADERMASAMENSVGQAQRTFVATTEQAEIAQRAWVYATVHPGTPDHFGAGKPLDIRVTFKNTGRTPALKVRAATYRTTIPTEVSSIFVLPDRVYAAKGYVSQGTIDPDSTRYADLVYSLTEEDVRRIDHIEVRIYVYGRIEYEDVFGTPRWTTFCTFLLPGGDFALCNKNNEIDNNQPKNLPLNPN
jgi:hypothetical protein